MNSVRKIKVFCTSTWEIIKLVFNPHQKKTKRTPKDFVTIRILDLPSIGVGCNPVTCGLNSVTVKMMADTLKSALEEAYPGKTATEYVNLMWTPEEQASEFGKLLMNKRKPSPLIIIADEIKYAGTFQVPLIVNEVGKIVHF